MSYRSQLPQSHSGLFLTDGGIETTLIFHEELDLPHFAAFTLLREGAGREALRRYFDGYARIAERTGTGLVLESPTWRANPDWAARLGYTTAELADANRAAIEMLARIRRDSCNVVPPVVISGCVGPRGDGYVVDTEMSSGEAETYHSEQIATFAETEADMICAITMTYVAEAVGIVEASRRSSMPVAISFTVETDGRLPGGPPLGEAISEVDRATGAYPAYYMVNCAHPSHFDRVVKAGSGWPARIGGIRANASRMSHAELDEAPVLDTGDPHELAEHYAELLEALPALRVLGGCCGTDHRHIEAVAGACAPRFAAIGTT